MNRSLFVFALLIIANSGFGQESSYKFGKGLNLESKNDRFQLKACGRIQTLYTSTRSEGSNNWEQELMIRRARLKFGGHAFTSRLSYKFEFGLSNRDRSVKNDDFNTAKVPGYILDAVLKYKITDYLEVWAGQTKLPGNRERVVSSQNLQLVDRSIVNSIFNLDREVGFQIRAKESVGNMVIRQMTSVSLGEGRNAFINSLGGYHYTARAEFLPLGEFANKGDYFLSDLKREPFPKLAFGATFSYNDNSVRQKATGKYIQNSNGDYVSADISTLLLDAALKYQGFSALVEFAYKDYASSTDEVSQYYTEIPSEDLLNSGFYTGSGLNVQAGYLFANNFEVATRCTRVVPNSATSFKGLNEYTLGLSQYFNGHKLKIQTDLSYTDYDNSAHSNKLRFRLQAEIGF